MNAETKFRTNHVDVFLKRLPNAWFESIQQVTIVGSPDKLGCISGWFVGMELKAESGVLAPMQRKKLYKVAKAGGIAIVARPQNWQDVKAILVKLSKGEYPNELHGKIFGDGDFSISTSAH